MKLTCAQMDVLISFYIEGDLSNALKKQVESHLKNCEICRAKFDIIKSMLNDLQNQFELNTKNSEKNNNLNTNSDSAQYRIFKENLSAYIDNELPNNENIKIKKFTINNPNARQELEDSYNIRKLMNDSFKKVKTEAKQDFSKNIIKNLELDDEINFGIHPAIKLLILFTISVLVITSLVLISLSV